MLDSIKTENLEIRTFSKEDTKRIFELSQESSLAEWIPDQVYKDEDEASSVLDYLISQYQEPLNPNKKPLVLAVALTKSGELIGHVGLSPYGENVEVGYAIAEEQSGKGYATEAVSEVSKWALSNLGVSKIYGIVACDNMGSARVLEKSDYKFLEESEQQYLGKMRLCRKYLLASGSNL